MGDRARAMLDHTMALSVAYVGLFNGLFDALAGARGARPDALAAARGLDAGYVRRWCEAAYAFGFLREARGRYGLTPFAREALAAGGGAFGGGQILRGIFAATIVGYNYALHMRDGARPGYGAMARFPEFAPVFGAMLEQVQRKTFFHEILPRVPAYAEVGRRGGAVLDLGCGNGWFLVALAQRFPGLSGVAVDFGEANISAAERKIREAGLQGRLTAQRADIVTYRPDRPFDLICLNQVVHDVWHRRGVILARARKALREGGRIALWDRPFPRSRRELRRPSRHFMVFLNLFEEMGGTRLLTEAEMRRGLREEGFAGVRAYRVDRGAQVVVVGQRARRGAREDMP